MNSLENILFSGIDTFVNEETEYENGAYIILRHNITDIHKIRQEFAKVYNLIYRQLKGTKAPTDSVKANTRVPLPKEIQNNIKERNPMMVSTMELTGKNDDTIISHHFVYGTHWHLKTEQAEKQFSSDIEKLFRNYLTSVNKEGNNFLIQPVGYKEEQMIDRNNEETITDYIRTIALPDSEYDLLEDEIPEDNLIVFFNKMRHPPSRYALYYSMVD